MADTNYTQQSLEKAYGAIGDIAGKPTALTPYGERTAPVQMGYGVDYQSVSPYQTTGTDYADYEQQLQAPVTQAYEQNLRDIQSQMGSSGLMGSRGYGLHDDTLTKAGTQYATGLLGAKTTAMNLQQQEEQARYQADMAEAARRQAYGEQQFGWDYAQQQQAVDWANQEAARQEAYANQERALAEQTRLEPYEMYSALAGVATPYSAAATTSAAQTAAAQSAADASNTEGWMKLAGTGVGLLGSTYGDDGWNFSDIGNMFSGGYNYGNLRK